MSESHFSHSYSEARGRFIAAAQTVGATIHSYPIHAACQEELAIDVAIVGAEDAPTVVTSSGIHGVEGFFGSAIQHALCERLSRADAEHHIRHVMIHALNPFGFSQLRRFNEDNVDLNRNFVEGTGGYRGAPDGYARLNRLLNPQSPPSRYEPFKLKILWSIWRHGLQALKQSVAGGQYEYPRGVFYGGDGPCQTTRVIYENCDRWIGPAANIVHIDFHSGLGRFGAYKILPAEGAESENYAWYANAFGADFVEALDVTEGTAYQVSGMFGRWMQRHFESRDYRFLGAEFGTYPVVRVLAAVRAENRAHHYAAEESRMYRAAKAELLECFCPRSVSWRKAVIESGLKIIAQAEQALD